MRGAWLTEDYGPAMGVAGYLIVLVVAVVSAVIFAYRRLTRSSRP